jgi:hypothetical protein
LAIFERIFVSSTVYDLLDVRGEVEALLRREGLTPILSDSPTSGFDVEPDRNSIESCLANVRNSDCVLVILSQRYGRPLTVLDTTKSATHLEYDEARKHGIPVYMYVRDRLEADYTVAKQNQEAVSASEDASARPPLKLPWVKSEHDAKGIFALMAEHRALVAGEARSNWMGTFLNSVDLKAQIARHMRIHAQQSALNQVLASGRLSAHVCDALRAVAESRAGLTIVPSDAESLKRWQKNVVGMLFSIYRGRSDDVSVVWLRPNPDRKLVPHVHAGKPYPDHTTFAAGEGFAGTAWQDGVARLHSPRTPHDTWVYRDGCDNSTYLCAPVNRFETDGGVLAVGSDLGFEASEIDLEALKIFANILGLSAVRQGG